MNKTIEDNKWKDRYLSLLDEQEDIEKSFKEKEDILCKTIYGLTIATTGFSQDIDPHLRSIREKLKNGVNSVELKGELEKFTITVSQIKPESKIDPALSIEIKIIVDHLLFLFNSIEIPSAFHQQVQSKKNILAGYSSKPDSFEKTIDKAFKLLIKIKQHSQSEQMDVDKFLSHITEQLAGLYTSLNGSSASTSESVENRDQLDQSVYAQIEEIKVSSTNTTNIDLLKGIINSRLENIAKEIHGYNEKELIQREKNQDQLDDLVNKLQSMEAESYDLKSKLMIANTQALRDTLTGLSNRNAYNERLKVELSRFARYKSPLSVVILDIDHFKSINDNYGHKAGDKVLALIAKQLSDNCRATDFISRFGGEEFIMLLPNTDKKAAIILANKLRSIIEKTGFNARGASISITISCGITEYIQSDTEESAFERADDALYQAKEQGRNRCCML